MTAAGEVCGLAAAGRRSAAAVVVMVVVGVLEQVVADLELDGAAVSARVSAALYEHDDDDDERGEDEHRQHCRRDHERHRPCICTHTRRCLTVGQSDMDTSIRP